MSVAIRAAAYDHAILNDPVNQKLVARWDKFINLEGAPKLKSDLDAWIMAQTLENQFRELKGQVRSSRDFRAFETSSVNTTALIGSDYISSMLGMWRQIYPRLVGLDLVGVQPLSQPTGKIFYLNLLRDDDSDPSGSNAVEWSNYSDYALHSAGEGGAIAKGMKIDLASQDVALESPLKLAVTTTLELDQDLRAYWNLSAMDLLEGAARDEIARELDARFVYMVRQAAIANRTLTFGQLAPTGWDPADWRHKLASAFMRADSDIFFKCGQASTFAVCGLNAAEAVSDMNTFVSDPMLGVEENGSIALQRIGSIQSKWKVFRSPYLNTNEIIVGRRGNSLVDNGCYFLPYVPLFVSDRDFDVSLQKTVQSFMSRFALKTTNNKPFVRIVIDPAGSSGITG